MIKVVICQEKDCVLELKVLLTRETGISQNDTLRKKEVIQPE
jgi:hypothetical protein